MIEVGEGVDCGVVVGSGVDGAILSSACDLVGAADGGGDGCSAGGVTNGATREVGDGGLARGTAVACGAEDAVGVAAGGRTAGCADVIGDAAARVGPTVP